MSGVTPGLLKKPDQAQSGLGSVGGVNKHTSGMEFYGTSSNFALLSQLISKARSRLSAPVSWPPESASSLHTNQDLSSSVRPEQDHASACSAKPSGSEVHDGAPQVLKDTRMSLVNLLFDEELTMPDSAPNSRAKTPVATEREPGNDSPSREQDENSTQSQPGPPRHHDWSQSNRSSSCARVETDALDAYTTQSLPDVGWVETCLEKEYMRTFFDNLHYIHPFLSQAAFTSLCERNVWNEPNSRPLRKERMHFLALYNAVIAVGALTAGTDALESLRASLSTPLSQHSSLQASKPPSSVQLSKVYFARAKKFLGDYFEVCSLESVQALILMVRMEAVIVGKHD